MTAIPEANIGLSFPSLLHLFHCPLFCHLSIQGFPFWLRLGDVLALGRRELFASSQSIRIKITLICSQNQSGPVLLN